MGQSEKAAREVIKRARAVADTRRGDYQTDSTYQKAMTQRLNGLRRAVKQYDATMDGKCWYAVRWRDVTDKGADRRQ